jgi:uncharacterized protein
MAYAHVLGTDERTELLRIARTTLKEYLLSGRTPPGAPHRKSLVEPASVFVSLHADGFLRGCIGTTQDSSPLYKAVQEMVVAAGSRDPRYPPVKLDELPSLNVEISVLGERRTMASPAELVVGEDGVQVTASASPRPQRGLLLPKVAAQQGWDAETFLARACEKAGLPPDYWRRGEGVVELFKAQTFDERSLGVGPFARR